MSGIQTPRNLLEAVQRTRRMYKRLPKYCGLSFRLRCPLCMFYCAINQNYTLNPCNVCVLNNFNGYPSDTHFCKKWIITHAKGKGSALRDRDIIVEALLDDLETMIIENNIEA